MMISENKSSITNLQKTGVEVLSQSTVPHHHYRVTLSLNGMFHFRLSNLLMTLFLICLFVASPQIASAKAKAPLDIQLIESDGIMNFVFIDRKSRVRLEQIQVERDLSNRLKFTIDGHRCQRSWKKSWRAKGFKRALVYPSKKQKGLCFLKVKMKRKITDEQFRAISKEERAEEGVLFKFAWDTKALTKSNVELLEDSEKRDDSDNGVTEDPNSVSSTAVKIEQEEEDSKTVDLIDESKDQTALENNKVPPPEAEVGEFPNMEVNEDQLGIQERPHSVIETVVIGQVEKARAILRLQ